VLDRTSFLGDGIIRVSVTAYLLLEFSRSHRNGSGSRLDLMGSIDGIGRVT
jgi:hypothetical protein